MKPSQPRKLELLAPAGGLAAFFAAVEAGADAVYCGFENFSARAKAKNFSITDLVAMAAYLHRLDKKIYVALNTLIKEEELPLLIETLGQLEVCGIDALIVQDLALWRLVRNHFPNLPLHASTQMTVHNRGGVERLAAMGFKRVVLARELTLAEIGAIGRETAIELEHFVHGALCYSISGQCLFSSLAAGKSGNRGRCVQPCRRLFNYEGQSGYYFSTSDLCAIEQLPQLIAAGITSFKIEGRMKSAEYVGRVVAAYRMVLDGPVRERPQIMAEARQQLELSFGRRVTSGFLGGALPTDITAPARQGTIGQYLGQVQAVRGQTITVKLEDRLHIGDRLKAMPKNDQTGVGITVLNLQVNNKRVKVAGPGTIVGIETPAAARISSGATLYKVAAEQAFAASEEACRQRLAGVKAMPAPLVLTLQITPELLLARGEALGTRLEKSYPVASYPARNRPLDREVLARAFGKGGDQFVLQELKAENLPAVVIPPSRLNEIRRDFFRQLATACSEAGQGRYRRQQEQATASLAPARPCAPATGRHLTVTVGSISEAIGLNNPLIARIAVGLGLKDTGDLARLQIQTETLDRETVWDLPAMIFPGEWGQYQRAVQQLRGQGFAAFRLNNLGHFALFGAGGGAKLSAGSQLYTMNSESGLAWQELGVSEIILPLENDRRNIEAFLAHRAAVALCLPVYGPIPLMISRIPVPEIRPGRSLASGQSERYQLDTEQGLTILTSGRDFSLLGHLAELQRLGVERFHLDLSRCGVSSPRGQAVLQACREDRKLPETTTFNFDRGLD